MSAELIQDTLPNIASFDAATLSQDFRCATVIASTNTEQNYLILLDTSLLAARKEELQNIAEESFHISVLLQQCTSFLTKMTENWQNSVSSFESKFRVYSTHLRDEGADSSLNEDLLYLLATGISCPALDRFLCSTMKLSVRNFGFFNACLYVM